jgi:hypothetical protein
MIPNEEQNTRFERWVLFIRKNFDTTSKEFLRYIWDLYDTLINEIKTLKNKNKKNGKANDEI